MIKIDFSAFDNLIDQLPSALHKALEKSAHQLAEEESQRTKGQLSKSFEVKSSGSGFEVTSNKHYAEFIENGRPGFSASPGKTLRFVINGEVLFRKSVGPAPAQPFVEESKKAINQQIETIFHQEISKIS